jgi:glycosyltransferase involved in cell wall biosynthesis
MGISVVIPAYNAGAFIEDAIASVLRQETTADEIIVVNDGSTDRDYTTLQDLHRTIRVINQPNRGVSAARNVGCDAASNDHVAILDADDIWLPGKLYEQMRYFAQNRDVDAVFCLGRYWTPKKAESVRQVVAPEVGVTSHPEARRLYYADFLCSAAVYPSTMAVKRSVWRALGGFNEGMRYGEDWDFYLRLSHGHRVALLQFIAMLYRQHPHSASAAIMDRNPLADTLQSAVQTLGLTDQFGNRVDRSKLKRRLFRVHFMHGHEHFWLGNFKVAKREFVQASRMDPLAAKNSAYLALSCLPGIRDFARRARGLLVGCK